MVLSVMCMHTRVTDMCNSHGDINHGEPRLCKFMDNQWGK